MRKRRRTLPGNKNATNAVMRWLDKGHPDYHLNQVYDRLSVGSLESFTKDAQAWLKDRSELRASTIECADWEEVYAYFKKMREG